ncbi:MAG: cytochrome c [Acidobacteria bacterium]|nr:cytochrome c [Acidobacteriota bacterium]
MTISKRLFALTIPAILLAGAAMAADAKKGQEVFENSACMGCHNTDTDEKRGNTPALKALYKKEGMTEAKVVEKIKKGGNGMPPYEEQLEKDQFADLLAYLKTL